MPRNIEAFKLVRARPQGIKYSSARTRSLMSLDAFCGGAQLREENPSPPRLPIDSSENLEQRFSSGVNRTDCPSQYGPASVDRKLGMKRFSLADAISGWVRKKGEPV